MEMTNMQADMMFGELTTIAASMKNGGSSIIRFGLLRNIRKFENELNEYFEIKRQLLQKYDITTDEQLTTTESGKLFMEEFTPIAEEKVNVDLHVINMTFDELCDSMEAQNVNISGDITLLELFCKKEGE